MTHAMTCCTSSWLTGFPSCCSTAVSSDTHRLPSPFSSAAANTALQQQWQQQQQQHQPYHVTWQKSRDSHFSCQAACKIMPNKRQINLVWLFGPTWYLWYLKHGRRALILPACLPTQLLGYLTLLTSPAQQPVFSTWFACVVVKLLAVFKRILFFYVDSSYKLT